jgi:hypothetical protein
MAEKDRKPGQNGKGSESRVSDIKTYHSNWQKIDWRKPKAEKPREQLKGSTNE